MEKKALITAALISTLLFSAIAGIAVTNLAKADPIFYLPNILIKSDGSIEPETEFITKSGSIYSLTADLQQKYAITIQCSNIVFDGEGHFINGSVSYAGYANIGLALNNVSNVLVKNVKVIGFGGTDIAFRDCSDCSLLKANVGHFLVEGGMGNEIDDNTIDELHLEVTGKNAITRNNITGMLFVENSNDNLITMNRIYRIFFRDSDEDTDGNIFLKNNFLCGEGDPYAQNFFEFFGTNFWDNGSVGNYWFDYDGIDADFNGIGDTPYFIKTKVYDEVNDKAVEIVIAQDNYPLMVPYDIEHNTIVLPQAQLFAAVIVAAVVILVGGGLLVYFKKRKH